MKCFECKDGSYVKVKEVHKIVQDKADLICVYIETLVCTHCGDKCLDDENLNKIAKAIDEHKSNKITIKL
jgi:hypothetical protein